MQGSERGAFLVMSCCWKWLVVFRRNRSEVGHSSRAVHFPTAASYIWTTLSLRRVQKKKQLQNFSFCCSVMFGVTAAKPNGVKETLKMGLRFPCNGGNMHKVIDLAFTWVSLGAPPSVSYLVQDFSSISTAIWIAIKLSTHMHVPYRMINTGDPLTFHPVLSSGQSFKLFNTLYFVMEIKLSWQY